MKVLLTHPSTELYGSDRMLAQTAEILSDVMDVQVHLPGEGDLTALLATAKIPTQTNTVPVLRKSNLSASGLLKLVASLPIDLFRAIRVVKESGCDTVYVNTIIQPWFILASRLSGKNTVVHVREAETNAPLIALKLLYFCLRFADLVICNSISSESVARRHCPSISSKTQVIYNGKDWTQFADTENIPVKGRIALIGRVSPRKGQDIALESLQLLKDLGHDCELVFAGDTFPGYEWYEDALKSKAKASGLIEKCIFLGYTNDVTNVLAGAELAIVPSREEPFGTVALEAWASGVPLIVSDVQGLSEIVTDGVNGLTFTNGDPKSLASACAALLNDKTLARKLTENAMDELKSRFSLANYASQMQQALEETAR